MDFLKIFNPIPLLLLDLCCYTKLSQWLFKSTVYVSPCYSDNCTHICLALCIGSM